MKLDNLLIVLLALLAILFLLSLKKVVYHAVKDSTKHQETRNHNYDSMLINQPVETNNKTIMDGNDFDDAPNGGFNDDLHDPNDTFTMNYEPEKKKEKKEEPKTVLSLLGLGKLDQAINGDDKYDSY